jgi:hypothetical protein
MKEILLAVIAAVLKGESENLSRLSAYVLGPLVVIAVTISNVSGGIFSVDQRPLSVVEIRTELSLDGKRISKRGAAFIIEQAASDYRIPLETSATRAWTSLSDNSLVANKERFRVEENAVRATPPFFGVTDPVIVVVDGQVGKVIEVLGGIRPVENFTLESRSGAQFVLYILIACAFTFGLSLATGFSSLNYEKHAAR